MKKMLCIALIGIICSLFPAHTQPWTHTARIAGGYLWPDMTDEEMRETVDEIYERGQNVILTWVSQPLSDDWDYDLDFLRKASAYIHTKYPDMALIIYQGPLEIVTPDVDMDRDGKVDPGEHSIYTDHPEWLQIGLDGRKAVFYGDFVFWVGSTDEDVWLCPNDPVYREMVISRVRELAETGIDGIWIDVPKFQCDFGDWEDNWACHCEDCQHKFTEDTGLILPVTVDWDDITWKTWVLWRQNVIADFIGELNSVAKSVNPNCNIIVEHWHGIDVESVKEAWSPILLREVTDCLAHEYPAASWDSSTYDYYNYLRDVASYLYYRGLGREHPSWVLAYSSEKAGQRMLAAALLTAGCNFYDTDVPDMDGTVSIHQQEEIFHWIKSYAPYYYDAEPWATVGVYYSKATMDFLYYEPWGEGDFYCEFMGVSMMLLSAHIPYKVIFSLDDLDEFHTVVLPNAACMSSQDIEKVNQFAASGGTVVATGVTGTHNEWGEKHKKSLDAIHIPELLGANYYREVQPFNQWWIPPERGTGEKYRDLFLSTIDTINIPPIYEVDSPGEVLVLPFVSENTLIFRILNLSGVSSGELKPQKVTLKVLWPVTHGSLYTFLDSPEVIGENPVTFEVYDHAVLVFNVHEPVTVISNSFDKPAADLLTAYLERNGFLVEQSSSCRSCMEQVRERNQLIILGGHQALTTGDLVDILLTEEEKQFLEQKGALKIFIKANGFTQGQTVIIVAGNEREDTFNLVEEHFSEIAKALIKPEAGYHQFIRI